MSISVLIGLMKHPQFAPYIQYNRAKHKAKERATGMLPTPLLALSTRLFRRLDVGFNAHLVHVLMCEDIPFYKNLCDRGYRRPVSVNAGIGTF